MGIMWHPNPNPVNDSTLERLTVSHASELRYCGCEIPLKGKEMRLFQNFQGQSQALKQHLRQELAPFKSGRDKDSSLLAVLLLLIPNLGLVYTVVIYTSMQCKGSPVARCLLFSPTLLSCDYEII